MWLRLRGLIGFRRLLYLLHLLDRLNWLLDLILFGFRLLRLLLGRFFYRSRDCTRSGKPTASYNPITRPPRRHVQRIRRLLRIWIVRIIRIRGLRRISWILRCEAVCEELGV